MIRKSLGALGAALALSFGAFTPALAAVETTGCGDDGCTLAELVAGGEITVDDVNFGGWDIDGTVLSEVDVDPSAISVVGGSNDTMVWIDFLFDPALVVNDNGTSLDFVLDFLAQIIGSTRTIINAELAALDRGIGRTGDSNAAVRADFGSEGFLDIFTDLFQGDQFSDNLDLAGLTSLATIMDIELTQFATGTTSFLAGFRFKLTLNGAFTPPMNEVPVPGALILMLSGLAGLNLLRRKRQSA